MINQDNHDSLLVSVPPEWAYYVASFLVNSLSITRVYDGVELSMFCEVGLGRTWAMDHEFKRLPSEKEFTDVAYSLLET